MDHLQRLPLFLLHDVLFPEERLPLRVFEARYLDMVSERLKHDAPFGICLIKAGEEVGEPAVPEMVGTLGYIEEWQMPTTGILHILVRGGDRFAIQQLDYEGRLANAQAALWQEEAQIKLPAPFTAMAEFLEKITEEHGTDVLPSPHRFDDASWVGMRLAQLLPVATHTKQTWLEERDPMTRLMSIRNELQRLADEDEQLSR